LTTRRKDISSINTFEIADQTLDKSNIFFEFLISSSAAASIIQYKKMGIIENRKPETGSQPSKRIFWGFIFFLLIVEKNKQKKGRKMINCN